MKKYAKKILSPLLATVLLITTLLSIDTGLVFAATSGTCGASGNNATWEFNSTTYTLTISGTGAIKNYGATGTRRAPWVSDNTIQNNLKHVVITGTINTIGSACFYQCKNIEDVTLPSSLTTINSTNSIAHYGPFDSCEKLTAITLPSGLTTIDQESFRGCSSLQSITFPDSVTSIGISAFSGCSALETVVFGSGITSVPATAFYQAGVKNVTWGGVTTIGTSAFQECKFREVELTDGVTSVGNLAFYKCSNMFKFQVDNANATFSGNVCDANNSANGGTFAVYGHGGSTAQAFAEQYTYTFVSIDPCDHTETETVVVAEPTCTTAGVTKVVCTACGQEISRSTVAALGHDWGDPTETDDRTETDGHIYKSYACSRCDATQTVAEHQLSGLEAVDISNMSLSEILNFDYSSVDASVLNNTVYRWVDGTYTKDTPRAPTCTAPGYERYTCSICEQKELHLLLPAHQVSTWTTNPAPTCTEKGKRTGHCTKCDQDIEEELPALGHDYDKDTPTRTQDNTETDGHIYTYYACTRCGNEVYETTHEAWVDGQYESQVVTTEYDCTLPALRIDTCKICNLKRQETVPGNEEHDLYQTDHTDATCTAPDITYYACRNCKHTEKKETEALGHDYQLVAVNKEPTCTETGLQTLHCDRCGMDTTEVIPANGHKQQLGSYQKISDPTCTAEGTYKAYCTVCEKEYTGTIEALGHDYQDVETPVDNPENFPGHVMAQPTCTRCNKTQAKYLKHKEWTEGYYTVTEQSSVPTCTVGATALKTCTCEGCTAYETVQTAPPAGHRFVYTGEQTADGLSYRCILCLRETSTIPASQLKTIWAGGIYAGGKPARTAENDSSYLDINLDGIINGRDYVYIKNLIKNEQVLIAEAAAAAAQGEEGEGTGGEEQTNP